ncbi:hypothetical protein Taro_024034, partial [Colocasia esculenta]|nr:hypothetical protein [Colocasia esculenta]
MVSVNGRSSFPHRKHRFFSPPSNSPAPLYSSSLFGHNSHRLTFLPLPCTSPLPLLWPSTTAGRRHPPNPSLATVSTVPVCAGHCGDCPVVEAFGSFVMDMFTAKSDLDLSLNFSADETGKGKVSGVLPILRARVPVLKVVHCGTGIECDISVENKDGISASLIVNLICLVDERFRILSFLMKVWAKAHDINSSKDHTLSSLSIILLVAFHLQTRDPPILPPFSALLRDGSHPVSVEKTVHEFKNFGRANKESVAELFISLLCKVSNPSIPLSSVRSLWESGLCASTYEGSWISKPWKSAKISVENFLDQSQNCARTVGEEELPKIYSCIDSSICHLMQFMSGQMESSDLNFLLFGPVSLHTRDKNALTGTKIPTKQKKKRKVPSHDSVAAPPSKNVSVAAPDNSKKIHYTGRSDALNGTKIPTEQKKKRKVPSLDSVAAPPSKNVSVAAPDNSNKIRYTGRSDALNGTKIPTEQKERRKVPSHDSVAAPPSKNVSVAAPDNSKKIHYTGRSDHLHSQIRSTTTLYPKHFVPSYHQPIPRQLSFVVQDHLKPPPDFSLPYNRQWPPFLSPTLAAYGSHLQGAPLNVFQFNNRKPTVAPNNLIEHIRGFLFGAFTLATMLSGPWPLNNIQWDSAACLPTNWSSPSAASQG